MQPTDQLTYVDVDFALRRVAAADNFAAVTGFALWTGDDADLGRAIEGVLGRLAADERAGVLAVWQASLKGSAVGRLCFSLRGDDGRARRIESVWHVDHDGDGRPRRAVVTCLDNGARPAAEAVLRESEARYRLALTAGRMGSWETDLLVGTRTWSPEGMALFGLDLPDGRGQVGGPDDEFRNAIVAEDRHLVEHLHELADRHDSFPAEYRVLRPDGTMLWLAGRGLVTARRPDGKALGLASIMADVSDRKRAEEVLSVERERLALALDAGQMGVFDMRLADGALWWSRQMHVVFGVSPETFVPTRESLLARIHPDDREAFLRDRRAAIAERRPFRMEMRIVRDDGSVAWILHRGQTAYDAAGRAVRTFGVAADITERKQAEQALREADRNKDHFIATLAHELRNPLAPIRNAIHILRGEGAESERAKWCREVLERQVAQMSRLLDDLLDVSRVSGGRLQLRRATLELRSVVDHAVEIARPFIDGGGHVLGVALPAEPIHVDGDMTRLAQVFSNLLINAAKYTPAGGRIELAAGLDAGEVVVTVTDSGIGIAADQLPRIFEMFGQVDAALDRSQGGLGIGLSLSRGLVEMHGGSIDARSAGLGQGSQFIVRLPASMPAPAVRAMAKPGSEAAAPPRWRVLVADDLRDSADSLGELLEVMGHEVHVTYDGRQALLAAEALRPDVALLDLGMPEMDGYDACRSIRAAPWGRRMTLIAQTGWGQDEDRVRTREAGFDHHLVKPIDVDALEALLGTLSIRPA